MKQFSEGQFSGGGHFSRGQFSRGAYFWGGAIFLGGIFPGGNFSGGLFPGGNFPRGNFLVGIFPGGFVPGGIFPDTFRKKSMNDCFRKENAQLIFLVVWLLLETFQCFLMNGWLLLKRYWRLILRSIKRRNAQLLLKNCVHLRNT